MPHLAGTNDAQLEYDGRRTTGTARQRWRRGGQVASLVGARAVGRRRRRMRARARRRGRRRRGRRRRPAPLARRHRRLAAGAGMRRPRVPVRHAGHRPRRHDRGYRAGRTTGAPSPSRCRRRRGSSLGGRAGRAPGRARACASLRGTATIGEPCRISRRGRCAHAARPRASATTCSPTRRRTARSSSCDRPSCRRCGACRPGRCRRAGVSRRRAPCCPSRCRFAWLFFVRRFDRARPEPMWLVLATFALGGLSIVPAGLVEVGLSMLTPWLDPSVVTMGGQVWALPLAIAVTSLVVGGAEEGSKFLGAWSLARHRREFDEPVDGIVYGCASALGFAAVENIKYFAFGRMSGVVIAMRAFETVPAHMFFGAIWGWAMGRTLVSRKARVWPWLLVACARARHLRRAALHRRRAAAGDAAGARCSPSRSSSCCAALCATAPSTSRPPSRPSEVEAPPPTEPLPASAARAHELPRRLAGRFALCSRRDGHVRLRADPARHGLRAAPAPGERRRRRDLHADARALRARRLGRVGDHPARRGRRRAGHHLRRGAHGVARDPRVQVERGAGSATFGWRRAEGPVRMGPTDVQTAEVIVAAARTMRA